jgi:hypothetical protein
VGIGANSKFLGVYALVNLRHGATSSAPAILDVSYF